LQKKAAISYSLEPTPKSLIEGIFSTLPLIRQLAEKALIISVFLKSALGDSRLNDAVGQVGVNCFSECGHPLKIKLIAFLCF